MNRTYSQHTQTLPRIHSQGKFTRTITQNNDKPKNDQPNQSEEKRTLTRLSSQRKTLQSANVSKAVRYEATNAVYLKKIEALEKQSFLLDKQIAHVNEEISILRIKKKTNEDSRSVSSKMTQRTQLSKIGTDVNNRFQVLRKKIDEKNQKNKQIQSQVDKVRREVTTTKHLNEKLSADLNAISQKLELDLKASSKLDEQISFKKEELKRKKIELIHQKTHIIKNYDMILKKLDEDLEKDSLNQSRGANNNIYLTDVLTGTKKYKKAKDLTQNSPKAKRNGAQLNYFKQKIEKYQKHMDQLKQATGCGTAEEAINKFSDSYEQNYSKYRFINQRFAHLQELKQKNADLSQRKQQLEQSLVACKTSRSACDLVRMQERMFIVSNQKNLLKDKIQNQQELFSFLKKLISESINKIPLSNVVGKYQIDQFTNFDQLITPQNLQEFLEEILRIKQQVKRNTKQNTIGRSSVNFSLEECLQNARKQGQQQKQRFLGREELIKLGRKVGKGKNMRN